MPILQGFEVSQYYIIASLQRTGSYLLCECLDNTGVAGKPTESLAPQTLRDLIVEWHLPFSSKNHDCEICHDSHPAVELSDFIPYVIKNGITSNGVFGAKIHYNQVEWIRAHLNYAQPGDTTVLDHLFPDAKYIRIGRRKNIREQAISSYKSSNNQEWWRKADTFNTQIVAPDPPYNSEKIRKWENFFVEQEKRWDLYFDERGIDPLYVEYDDLARDYWHETRRCLAYLGLDPSAADNAPEPTLIRQADAVTRAWKRRLDEEDAK